MWQKMVRGTIRSIFFNTDIFSEDKKIVLHRMNFFTFHLCCRIFTTKAEKSTISRFSWWCQANRVPFRLPFCSGQSYKVRLTSWWPTIYREVHFFRFCPPLHNLLSCYQYIDISNGSDCVDNVWFMQSINFIVIYLLKCWMTIMYW